MTICSLYNSTSHDYRKCLELEKDITRTAEDFREEETAKWQKRSEQDHARLEKTIRNLTEICSQRKEAPSCNGYLSRAWNCITDPLDCLFSDPATFTVLGLTLVTIGTAAINYAAQLRALPAGWGHHLPRIGNGDANLPGNHQGGGGGGFSDFLGITPGDPFGGGSGSSSVLVRSGANAALAAHEGRILGGSLRTPDSDGEVVRQIRAHTLSAQQLERQLFQQVEQQARMTILRDRLAEVSIIERQLERVRQGEMARQLAMASQLDAMSARLAALERERTTQAVLHSNSEVPLRNTGQRASEISLEEAMARLEGEIELSEEQRRRNAHTIQSSLTPDFQQGFNQHPLNGNQGRGWVSNLHNPRPPISEAAEEARKKGPLGPWKPPEKWQNTLRHEEF